MTCVSPNLATHLKLELVSYKFNTLEQALNWWNSHNPARQKSINLLEDESRARSEDSSAEWATMCTLIYRAIGIFAHGQQKAFRYRYLGDRDKQLNAQDIASLLMVSTRTVKRWTYTVFDEVERVFIAADVIPPRDKHLN